MDQLTHERRSALMRSVSRANTAPELVVRKLTHRMGGRYLTNDRRLPGTPDLVFPKRRIALFVHGCFWHRHSGCVLATTPKSNRSFWSKKFRANVQRDKKKQSQLRAQGWRVVVIWQCETLNVEVLRVRLARELSLCGAGVAHEGVSSSR